MALTKDSIHGDSKDEDAPKVEEAPKAAASADKPKGKAAAKDEEKVPYLYVGAAQLVLVMVDGTAYELLPGQRALLPKAAEGLDKHSDFVKVK
jgi:hypothetical protein